MRKIFYYIALLGSVSFLSACSIYGHYSRPEDVSTDNLFGENVATTDTLSIARIPWREFFTDVQLQALIDEGLRNNYDLKSATLRIDEAQAALSAARLSYFPTFSFSPSAGLSYTDFNSVSSNYKLPIEVGWEIDLAGRLFNKKNKAKVAYQQSLVNRQAVQTRLVAAIANQYYTLLMLDSQLAVSRTTAANWKENVRIMRAMMDAGMTNKASISQTEANSYAIEASLFDLERQIREVENSLALLIGSTPHTIERGKLDEQTTRVDFSVGVPAQLLVNRPDVRGAELDLAMAHYTTNLARSAFYPSIKLGGTLGWQGAGASLANPGEFLLSLVGSLVQPIFNGGANRAQLKIAKSQQEQTRLAFVQTLLNAGAEVNDALMQFQTALNKTDVRKRQIEALESAVESTQLLMRHGDATYLEVLTAQQNLLSAQLKQISDRFEGIQGVVNLYQALGGGAE
jgi:NodT family efflux transporter outer membrane factor (OMF) lipoprotein